MVEYTCKFCKKNYDSIEEAEKCEEKGLIGPDIKPGLLLSSKNTKPVFKLFYNELPPEGHYRKYLTGQIYLSKTNLFPIKLQEINSSKLNMILKEKFKISTEKEVNDINKLINNRVPLTGEIRNSMEENNVKILHNNLELKLVEVDTTFKN